MKEFTLEEYLKNPERKVVTRDGRNARIMGTDAKRAYYPVLALVDKGSHEASIFYTKNGQYSFGEENSYDLFFAPEKKEGWINIFKHNFGEPFIGDMHIFSSKEEAEESAKNDRTYVKSIKIEWEE